MNNSSAFDAQMQRHMDSMRGYGAVHAPSATAVNCQRVAESVRPNAVASSVRVGLYGVMGTFAREGGDRPHYDELTIVRPLAMDAILLGSIQVRDAMRKQATGQIHIEP